MDELKIKCTKCFVLLPASHFKVKRDETLTKNCIYCLNKRKEQLIKYNQCSHVKNKQKCKTCNPCQYICHYVKSQLRLLIKNNSLTKSVIHTGCDIAYFKRYINKQLLNQTIFTNNELMTWDNYDKLWKIGYIKPLKYDNQTLEETHKRLHFRNTAPELIN
jgi:hypothetical protein